MRSPGTEAGIRGSEKAPLLSAGPGKAGYREITSSPGRSSGICEMEKGALASRPDSILCEGHGRCRLRKLSVQHQPTRPPRKENGNARTPQAIPTKGSRFLLAPPWAERKHRASCPGTRLPEPSEARTQTARIMTPHRGHPGHCKAFRQASLTALENPSRRALHRSPPTTGGREPTGKAREDPWLGR